MPAASPPRPRPVPSQTFLFDAQRTGRAPFAAGIGAPRVAWRTWMPSHPTKGPESTPAFDDEGNLYFGSHDGCFYSLSPAGRVRWMFKTDEKIYSSPALRDGQVVFCGGNGFVYGLDLDGRLRWHVDLLGAARREGRRAHALRTLREFPETMDWQRMYNVTTKSWASPVQDADGHLYVTGYGAGLLSLTADGQRRWARAWDAPHYELCGPCFDTAGRVVGVSRSGVVECLTTSGALAWSHRLSRGGENWSTPSHDPERRQTYVSQSFKQSHADVLALGDDGAPRWRLRVAGGVRGTVTVGRGPHAYVPALDGRVLFVDRDTGRVEREVRVSRDARGLWASICVDAADRLLLAVKESNTDGAVVCLEADGQERWRLPIGKALCTPVVDALGRVYAGSWDGHFYCVSTA